MSARAMSVLAASCLAHGAVAQEFHWWISGVPYRQIGAMPMAGIGDLNQDGYEDLLTIVHGQCGQGSDNQYLWLISGRDGARLREVDAGFLSFFEEVGAAGDDNNDGTPDYVVGFGSLGPVSDEVQIRSGLDDSVLWSVPPYVWGEIQSGLDIDADGQNDLIVADWHANNWLGEIRGYGHGGTQLWTRVGDTSPTANPPLAIANDIDKIGDVNDDGREDIAMGCYEPTGRGAVAIVSGADGSYLRVCYGQQPGDGIGYNVEACGDLDGDGYTDFASGNGGTFFVAQGVVSAFSSRTGQQLFRWVEPMHNEFSKSVASRGVDLDGDAMPDVVVGAPTYYNAGTSFNGAGHAFSGRDGTQLWRVNTPLPNSPAGAIGVFSTTLLPRAGDHVGYAVFGDYLSHFVTVQTSTGSCSRSTGSIRVYRGLPRTASLLGSSCPGTLPSAPDIGMRSLAVASQGVRVHLAGAPAGAPSVLLLGLSTTSFLGVPLPAALDPFGFSGCHLLTSIDAQALTVAGSQGTAEGYVAIDLPHPVPTTGQGSLSISAQWVVLGLGNQFPGGTTQAVVWRR